MTTLRKSALAAVALGLMLIVVPTSAFGAVAAVERVSAVTATDSSNKDVTAICPAGKRLLGTGGNLGGFGGHAEVKFDEIAPNSALTAASVAAVEDESGYAGPWDVSAHALCATTVPGLQRVSATSPMNSSNKGVTATCPAGKRVLGTGAVIELGAGEVSPVAIVPNPSLNAVSVYGAEDGTGYSFSWNVTAYAICANPIAGLELRSARGPTISSSGNLATATCPSGKQVTGAGGDIRGPLGRAVLTDLIPFSDPAQVEVIALQDDDPAPISPWSVGAYAICAPTSELVVAPSPTDSEDKGVFSTCPAGTQLTGAGGDITGGFGQVVMDSLSAFPTISAMAGAEDETGTAANWSVRSYAICAPPPAGVVNPAAASAVDSSPDKNATATCPPGKRVIGGGGTLSEGTEGQVGITGLVPNPGLTSITAVASEDETEFSGDWSIVASAICAIPPKGLQLVSVTSDSDSDELKTLAATCPAGKNLLGVGADLPATFGQVALDDLRPNARLTSVTATGIEDETGYFPDWTLVAHAICANP